MGCNNASLFFAILVVSLFVVLILSSLKGEETFDKRWPTSYYEQGGWYKPMYQKKPQNRSNYKRYNLAMWNL